ncbi:MAG: hypothetical protein ACYC8T_25470 [Myxococcaceae bacterium]
MKKLNWLVASAVAVPLLASPALAADYRCNGNSVEKSGSTKYTVRTSGSEITIEKSGSTKGKAVKGSSGKWTVEVSGSTQATIEEGKIFKSGSSWATVSEAKQRYDCPDVVAATLWVLDEKGQL